MGEVTGIAWTDATFNLAIGCSPVSPGCAKCYARDLARNRMGLDVWDGKEKRPRKILSETYWKQPLKWNRDAERDGVRRRVFCSSMADAFEDHETVASQRERLWPLILATPHLDWLLLTKRPENVLNMVPITWTMQPFQEHPYPPMAGWPANVWIGTSVENQHWADIRIPELLKIPAHVRFLSVEPLLGPVDLSAYLHNCPSCGAPRKDRYADWCGYCQVHPEVLGVSWVIVGGESGPHHRLMQPEWAYAIRDQCINAKVPLFFKQWGGRTPKSGGDLLDGRQWHEFPAVAEPVPAVLPVANARATRTRRRMAAAEAAGQMLLTEGED